MTVACVLSPRVLDAYRLVSLCVRCRQRRRLIVQTFEYYEATLTCCACGTTWGYETKPSRRDETKAARAKKTWATLTTVPR